MWVSPQFPADLVTLTEEILSGKLNFLSSESKNFLYGIIVKHQKTMLRNVKFVRSLVKHFIWSSKYVLEIPGSQTINQSIASIKLCLVVGLYQPVSFHVFLYISLHFLSTANVQSCCCSCFLLAVAQSWAWSACYD